MKNRDKFLKYFTIKKIQDAKRPLWVLLIAILIVWSAFMFYNNFVFQDKEDIAEREELEEVLTKALIASVQKLKSRWEYGDLEGNFAKGKFNCPKEILYSSQVDDQYLRCNPNYIQCFFDGNAGTADPKLEVSLNGKVFTIIPKNVYPLVSRYSPRKRFYKVVSRSIVDGAEVPSYGIMMTLTIKEHPGYSLNLVLEDTCHDTYLPQRIYGYGASSLYLTVNSTLPLAKQVNENDDELKSEDWTWDNFYRDIFIDKFLVTYRDLIEWIEYGKGSRKINIPWDAKEWFKPATGITLEDMKRFCAFRGKQLLEAHIYDAATFYPSDLENPRPMQVLRGPYPWTRKRKGTLFFRRNIPQQGPEMEEEETENPDQDTQEKLLPEQCRLTYVKECQDIIPMDFYSSNDTSWIEMNQILGGYLEALRNPIHPHKNLKASSLYFSSKSTWHQLGMRANWDGLAFSKNHFRWDQGLEKTGNNIQPENEEDFYKIGFRCMTFSEGEK